MSTGDIIELPNIAKATDAIRAARQVANIPEDWTVMIIENKITEILVACAPPTYGPITPEKCRELQTRKASDLSAIPKPVANPKSVIVVMTYAHLNSSRKTDPTTRKIRAEDNQTRQELLDLWVAKMRND
jgi:hypothetical protein